MDIGMTILITMTISQGIFGILRGDINMVVFTVILAIVEYIETQVYDRKLQKLQEGSMKILEYRNHIGNTVNVGSMIVQLEQLRNIATRAENAGSGETKLIAHGMKMAYYRAIVIVSSGGRNAAQTKDGAGDIDPKGGGRAEDEEGRV